MIWNDANWIEPNHRPRGWHLVFNEAERDSNAALVDPRPEPGFWPTLAAFIRNHPRTTRFSATMAALIVAAQIGAML